MDPRPVLIPSFDGTEIAVRSTGEGPGIPVLLSSAVGATLALWRTVLAEIGSHHRIVTWDLRGLHDSPRPESPRLDPAVHARDAIAAMDNFQIEEFAVAAWSNGSRIAFEIGSTYPRRVRALATVNGGHGYSLERLLRYLEPSSALPLLAGIAKRFPSAVGMAFRRLAERPELPGVIRQSGLVGPSADTAALAEVLRAMSRCDTQRLLATFEAVAGSGATGLLPSIPAATLLIAGGHDHFTPRRMVDEMHSLLPNSRVHVYEKATHFLPLEYPRRLADDLLGYLADFAIAAPLGS
ncbi:MAG: alpha/beta hydrolase [Actinomycetota bacterium]|nr:alpha/beta hydrolase [Actinomycetota bacterium]